MGSAILVDPAMKKTASRHDIFRHLQTERRKPRPFPRFRGNIFTIRDCS
jgi:hypothetical protein